MVQPSANLARIATHLGFLAVATAFKFQTTPPQQCGQWTVEWDGGTGPFFLVVVPAMDMEACRIMNVSMTAVGSPPYRHSFTLPQPAGLKMVATMYDADGFGSGGATDILTVGSSSDTSCLDTSPNSDFYFWTEPQETDPVQCQTMSFTWDENAQNPVGLHGIVPGGTSFDVPLPASALASRTYDYMVNIEAGTEVIFLMSDAGRYGSGGNTRLLKILESSNASCLGPNSPKSSQVPPLLSPSTAAGISRTSLPTPTSTVLKEPATGGSEKSNTGTIVGAAVGVIVTVLLALIIAFLFYRRRSKQKAAEAEESETPEISTPPASILADDSGSVMLPVHPFPYQSQPPRFHTLGIHTNFPSDTKAPLGSGAAAMGGHASSSFNGSSSPPTTTDTSYYSGGEKSSHGSILPQQHLRSQMDHLRLSNLSSIPPMARMPSSQGSSVSAQGATGHNMNAVAEYPSEPPPQYSNYDRLRAVNPDPSEVGSVGGSPTGGR